MNLIDIFLEKGQHLELGIVFIEGAGREDQFLSYAELKTRAQQVLFSLQSKGLKPGDELIFQIDDNKSFIIAFWASIFGGFIPVPLSMGKNDDHKKKFFQVWSLLNNPSLIISQENLMQLEQFGEREGLKDLVVKVRAKSVFIDDAFLSFENGIIHKPNTGDTAFIQFSSGSTGNPKGIILTHENLIANIKGITKAASYTEKDTMISWMPLTHDMGMIGFHLNPLICGLNHYLMPTNLFIRNPRLWLDKIAQYKISITCSPNFGYRYFLKNFKDNQQEWDLSGLRIIYNGAEPISEKLCREFNEKLSKYGLNEKAMCPVYGLAEASVAVCISDPDDRMQILNLNRHKLNPGDKIEETESQSNCMSLVSVGKPIEYCSVKITNQKGQTLDEKTIGNIRIKGENVTSGYYNNINSFNELIDKEGWLDTGDLGFIKDGAIYIAGRTKDIIFVNGQNYYSHDIEKEAESLAGIELNKIAVSGSLNVETQTEEVTAFLFHRGVLRNLVPVAVSLKNWISERFGFEIHKVIPVKDIPRTTSGKLQRYEMMRRYRFGEYQEVEKEFNELLEDFNEFDVVPPSNAAEREILNIWEEVFQSNAIGVEKNFFQIGGDSLKATELIMKLHHQLHVELPFESLYRFLTVRKLATEISNLKHKEFKPIPKAAEAESYPVSSSQRRIYYACKINSESIAYNIPVVIKLEGKVDFERLNGCLQNLVQRHDAFRMTFHLEGEPRFQIAENLSVKLDYVKYPGGNFDEILRKLVLPFDLSNGPLCRFVLLQNESIHEYAVLMDFHHLISDGRSAYLFAEELLQLYNDNELPLLNTSFKDFVVWESQQKNKVDEAVKNYWTDQFSDDVPVLELPFDFSRSAIQSNEGKRLTFILDKNISSKIKGICKEQKTSAHSFLFTVYNILLAKYSGQEDIIIGIPSQGRKHLDLQQVQGMFVNNLPIRNRFENNYTFTDLLKCSFELINQAVDHQNWAYDDLINHLQLPPQPGRNPLFDTMFLYQNWKLKDSKDGVIKGRRYSFDPGYSKFDISIEIFEENDFFNYDFEYSIDLFKDETILKLSEGFANIINSVIENPEIKIADLSPLRKEEFEDIIFSCNATDNAARPFVSVLELFEEQVRSNPLNIALEFEGKYFTYADLHDKVQRIGNTLKNKKVKEGDLVGIHLKRSPELVAAVLGILKAGAAYLPLESDTPLERIMLILRDSRCKFLISDIQPEDLHLDNGSPLKIWPFDSLLENANETNFLTVNRSGDLAYVIYTSGTTGTPKGVMIDHVSLSNYITWAGDTYIGSGQFSFALYSSISFDLTVTSIFAPLITGNKIVIYGENDTEVAIESVIRDNKVDIVKLTPSHLRILRENNLLSPATKIKRLIVGGEVLDTRITKDIYELTEGKIEIFNEYGPTEATVGCMIYKFNHSDTGKTVSIGQPITGTQIYLLDKYLKPVPVNVPGEIYIAGKCLARGYLFHEELTNIKFIENPYIGGKMMYKSGDLAKRLPNGNVEYIGRNDQQVKISGNRVELSEIEAHLTGFPNIQEAVVLVDVGNSNTIIAYLKLTVPRGSFSDISIRNYLVERLPYFMIPKAFIRIDAVPLTHNGKVDIVKLQAIETGNKNFEKKSPESDIEKKFVKVWADVLNIDEIGTTDNFFEHGGDSIKAVQISSRLFQEGISVKVKDILTYHTIENISRYAEFSEPLQQYEQGVLEGEFAPSPIQSWFFNHKYKTQDYYNQSALFKMNSTLDVKILERTFEALIVHHDTLRLNYDKQKQVFFYNNNHLAEKISIEQYQINEEKTLDIICNKIRDSFDISKSLLFKAAVLKKEDGTVFLFMTAHHLVMDGISWRILLEDFYKGYLAIINGNPIQLPQKTASFRNWSLLLKRLYISKEFGQENDYWKEMEQSTSSITQNSVTNDLSVRNTITASVSIGTETTDFLLKGAHKPYNTDVPIILNVALLMTLKAKTGLDEFIIEQENHGRHLESLNTSRTIGWFTAIYPVKLIYKDETGVLIKSVKEVLRKVPNNGIGYGIITFLSDEARISSFFPEIRLNYMGQFGQEMSNSLLSLSALTPGNESHPDNVFTPKIECNSWIAEGKFTVHITASLHVFSELALNEFANSFIRNLNAILLYLKEKDEVHFTPSDFSTVDLEEEEINDLFGD